MSNLSQWTGTARLVADAELNSTPNGRQVLKMRLAVNTGYKDAARTMWLAGSMWGNRGAELVQWLQKGKLLALSGQLSSREYTDKNNVPRMSIELNVQELELLSTGSKEAEARPIDAPADDTDPDAIPF
jgi:single-strand DNA-binding protein